MYSMVYVYAPLATDYTRVTKSSPRLVMNDDIQKPQQLTQMHKHWVTLSFAKTSLKL